MIIIPVINCQDFDAVKNRFIQAEEILFGAGGENRVLGIHEEWVHIDVADGSFTDGYQTWRLPEQLQKIKHRPELKIEVHLMVKNPEEVISSWLTVGINRLIVHLEATENLEALVSVCKESGVEIFLALKPETPITHAFPYIKLFDGLQILAVAPGLSGQATSEAMIAKIKDARAALPDTVIEFDGGVSLDSVAAIKAAGANQAVSGSFIFSQDNPAHAYQQLVDFAA
jgi:ribulose-phosphate 3-epimerase